MGFLEPTIMKIITNQSFSDEKTITCDFIKLFDGENHEYMIRLNDNGELEITSVNGNISLNPKYANSITLKSSK